jgi:hypothetical protein
MHAFQHPAALAELKQDMLKALFPDNKLKVSFCSSIGQPIESLTGDAYLDLGNLNEVEGLLKEQYNSLPIWDIIYLQIEKGKSKVDVHLSFSTYIKIIMLSKMNILAGCIPPDFLMWKDSITSNLSRIEIRDLFKLHSKSFQLSNNTKITIDYNGNFKAELV